MTIYDWGNPHIPLSKLRELRKISEREIENWTTKDIWLFLVRQEIDRLDKTEMIRELYAAYTVIAQQKEILDAYDE